MGTFSASLRVQGDTSALPATLLVEDGRLKINSGDQPIGDWSLADIDLNRTDAGYQIRAEGEKLFLNVTDIAAFDEAVTTKKARKARRAKKERTPKKSTKLEMSRSEAPVESKPARPEGQGRIMSTVDGLVDRAERRFGPLLPSWVFTRFTVFALVGVLIGAIILPGLASGIALVGGLAIVVFGAVLYTDDRMATKILPGRSTPTHVLITGVGVLLVGVLIGTIAS